MKVVLGCLIRLEAPFSELRNRLSIYHAAKKRKKTEPNISIDNIETVIKGRLCRLKRMDVKRMECREVGNSREVGNKFVA
jgi:hypothetical protein